VRAISRDHVFGFDCVAAVRRFDLQPRTIGTLLDIDCLVLPPHGVAERAQPLDHDLFQQILLQVDERGSLMAGLR
jgi:hypothetical protein